MCGQEAIPITNDHKDLDAAAETPRASNGCEGRSCSRSVTNVGCMCPANPSSFHSPAQRGQAPMRHVSASLNSVPASIRQSFNVPRSRPQSQALNISLEASTPGATAVRVTWRDRRHFAHVPQRQPRTSSCANISSTVMMRMTWCERPRLFRPLTYRFSNSAFSYCVPSP